MEKAWEGIINVHKWHLKNAVLNYCEAVAVWRRKLWSAHLLFFGNTFHLWLSHVISAWAAAARCLGSLPLPLLSPTGKGNGFFWCIFCFMCFSLSSPQPLDVLVYTKTVNGRQQASWHKGWSASGNVCTHLAFVWTKPAVPWYTWRWCHPCSGRVNVISRCIWLP